MIALLLVLVPDAIGSEVVGVEIASCLDDVVAVANTSSGDVVWKGASERGGCKAEKCNKVELHLGYHR